MSEEAPPEAVDKPIVVTAITKVKDGGSGGGGGGTFTESYVTVASYDVDIFAQTGGGEDLEVLTITVVAGNIVVRHQDITFPFIIRGEAWDDMKIDERAAILKTIAEYDQSPLLLEAIQHLEQEGVGEIEIRWDNRIWFPNGVAGRPLTSEETGFIVYPMPRQNGEPIDPTGRDITAGGKIVIIINSDIVNGASETAKALMHELRHPVVPGINHDDEWQVSQDEIKMFNSVWKTGGNVETDQRDYLPGTTIVGSYNNDVATGSTTNDTLAGLSGDDILDGGGGDDLVMGGAGMDIVSGGLGSNAVQGGLGADTYAPAVGVTHEQVADIGGVDRIDLSSVSIGSVSFMRFADDLFILAPGIAVDGIGIAGQWLDASRVEQFTFAEGTYAASYIESLAGQDGGVCYDDMGQPLFCSPYGLPVVLDLDGDGLELIELAASHVRFDVDGDGRTERVGWVHGDDGILALDRNSNGRIDDFSEISFRADFLGAGTDLEGLYAYDSDGDGFLTAADARFGEFLVWKDVNGNGHSERRELFSLSDLGIVSLSLERRDVAALDRNGGRNQILATSTFETADGALHRLGDIALFADMAPVRPGAGEDQLTIAAVPFA